MDVCLAGEFYKNFRNLKLFFL